MREQFAIPGDDVVENPRCADVPEAPSVELRPATVCFTAYGLRIDRDARALGNDGNPITGLFAAGECTGGIVGAQYVGSGNSYANCVTFGRIAGRSAAALAGGAA